MTNNEMKKVATDVLLDYLKEIGNQEFYVAGGAPRDWYFGKEVNDVDVYYEKSGFKFNHREFRTKLENAGIKTIGSRMDSKSSKYSFNSNIKKVNELKIWKNIASLPVVRFDLIQVEKLDKGFENIFASYDTNICMVGYKDNTLYFGDAFCAFDDSIKRHGKSAVLLNDIIDKRLMDWAKQKHFPKLKKKYPEITEFTRPDFKLNCKVHSTNLFNDYKPKVNSSCNHKWGAYQLLFSTVYNCVHCGANQEDCV